jgi:hypothetical protein
MARPGDLDQALHVEGHALSLGWEGPGERHATPYPDAELALGRKSLPSDEDPALHRPTSHIEDARVRSSERLIRRILADTNHQFPAIGDSDRHVAVEQERQAAEHGLLVALAASLLHDGISGLTS